MAWAVKKAKDLKVGDILKATQHEEMLSVKEVRHTTHPVFRTPEVTVRGALGMVRKFQAEDSVNLIRAV